MARSVAIPVLMALALSATSVLAQDQCRGCINPTVTCSNAVKIGDNPLTYYLPCLAGQPINSLEQAAGCVATYPNVPFSPTATVTTGRKLSMTSPVRSLLQSGGSLGECASIGQDAGAICPTAHNGLGSASLSYGAVGLGQPSSSCPPYNVNFVLAGSCDVGGKSARSRVTSCATTAITVAPTSGVIQASDFGCVAVNDFSVAGVSAAQSWYFQDVVSGKDRVAWTPFLNGRSCQYKVAAFASNQCKALNDANTFTVTIGNGPLATGALAASCPKIYSV